MRTRLTIGACAVVAALAAAPRAEAAIWAWGCQGRVDGRQIIFNRYALIEIPAKAKRAKLDDLIHANDLANSKAAAAAGFDAGDVNSGLTEKMEFIRRGDGERLTLTEISSTKLAVRTRTVHKRDEIRTRMRKLYRLVRGGGPVRMVTMQCIDYLLSTRGGR